jgi:putative membrane protein
MSPLNAMLLIGLLSLPLTLPIDAQAQHPAGITPKGEDARPRKYSQDETFLREAALSGRTRLQSAQMARRKASSEQVRDFAKMLGEDHTVSNRVIGQLAAARKIEIPLELDDGRQGILDGLERQTGVVFDGAFLQNQVEGHKRMIQLFEAEAKDGQDPDLRSFAREQIAVLKRHLEQGEKLMAPPSVSKKR